MSNLEWPTDRKKNCTHFPKANQGKITDSNEKSRNFVVMFWNGGGKLLYRIRTNPELNNLINRGPDIFAYAEALIYKQTKSPLPHYDLIVHTAKKNTLRRGLAIFCSQNYRYNMRKAHESRQQTF